MECVRGEEALSPRAREGWEQRRAEVASNERRMTGRSSGLSGLSGLSGPPNQTDRIDQIDQRNQLSAPHPEMLDGKTRPSFFHLIQILI